MIYFWLFLIIFFFGFLAIYNTQGGKNTIDFWRFYIKGSQKGFSFYELRLLWRLNSYASENAKAHFFSSASSLDFCIKLIQEQIDQSLPDTNTEKAQICLPSFMTIEQSLLLN